MNSFKLCGKASQHLFEVVYNRFFSVKERRFEVMNGAFLQYCEKRENYLTPL